MLMIIWGHWQERPDCIHDSMNPVWLSAFVLVAGYFSKSCSFTSMVRSKSKCILIPWICFCFIGYLSQLIMYATANRLSEFRWNMVCEDIITGNLFQANIPVWFLPALFIMHCAIYFVRRWIPSGSLKEMSITFGAGLAGFYLLEKEIYLPFQIAKVLYYLPFYTIGTICRKMCIQSIIMSMKSRWHYLILCCSLFIFLLRYIFVCSYIDELNVVTYLIDIAISLIVMVSLIACPLRAERNFYSLIAFIGEFSLHFMGFHIIIMGWLWNISWSVIHRPPNVYESGVLLFMVVFFCGVSAKLVTTIKRILWV